MLPPRGSPPSLTKHVLAVDVGGTHVKILASGRDEPGKFVSGPTLTARQWLLA